MGRPTNAAARRAQIADALVMLLAQSSFEEITVAAMAKAAGLAAGLVHHHFASKAEILGVAVDRLTIQLEQRLAERLRNAGEDPLARVHGFVDAWLALDAGADPRAAFAWVAIGDEARRRPEVRAIYAAAIARAVERMSEEVARVLPKPRRRDAAPIARAIIVAIEGALRVGSGGGLEPGTAAPLVRAVADSLLSPKSGRG